MFYSQSLLSRKGPLGNIWVAAHCYTKLKKEQVAGTNISSTVDKIIPDAQLSYRVLAHLLIGVVRIFSKKVDYLFHDCNEVLICLGKIVLSVHKTPSKRDAGSCRQKPSFINESEEITLASNVCDSTEAICASRKETVFSMPKTFNLDSFDLEVPDEENHDHFRLEVEDESEMQRFSNKRHDDEMVARSDFYSGCFTPAETNLDFFPSCFTPEQDVTSFIYGEWEHADKSNDTRDTNEMTKQSGARRSLFVNIDNRVESSELPLPDVSKKILTPEGNAEFCTPVKATTEFTVTTPAIKDRQPPSSKRKCVFDDTIILPNQVLREWIHSSSDLVGKRRKALHLSLSSLKSSKTIDIKSRLLQPLIPSMISEKSNVPPVQWKRSTVSRKLDFEEHPPAETTPIEPSSLEVPSSDNMVEEETHGNFENEISIPDMELNSREEEVINQDGLSTRTRSVARFFNQYFEKEKEGELHALKILEGKSRTRCAQVFYETLVLKSRGCIDVKQESPYGEIAISAKPALKEILASRGTQASH